MTFDDPLAFSAVDAEGRDRYVSAINERRCARDTDQAAPSAGANERSEAGLLEVKWKAVAARAAPSVDEHGFGTAVGDGGPGPILPISYPPVIERVTAQQFYKSIRDLAAAVESLVDDQPGFIKLRSKLSDQLGLSMPARIGHVNVTDLPPRGFFHFLAIFFNP